MVEVWSLFPSPTRRSWPKRRSPSPSSRPTWKASWVGRLWIAQGRQGQAHYKIYILSNYYLIYFMLVAKLFFFTRLLPNCPCPYCYLGVKCPRAFLVQNCLCAKLPHYFCETKLKKRGFLYFSEAAGLNALFKARPEGWDAGWLDQWGSSSRRRASAKPDVGNVWLFLYFIFLVIDDMYSLFTAPLRGGCALQNQDPGQWNDLEAFFDTFLFKSNLHLFVDVVEDVANSRKSRSTIGIKHGGSHNLKLCLDFIQWCFLF